jgi:hypothetical protein
MRLNALAFVGVCAALAPAASGQDALRLTRTVESVRVEVTWVASQAELKAKSREYGVRWVPKTVINTKLHAFSVLGTRDGELVCLIFAPKPERFDDRVNTSLGHELLHCFGFSHAGD